MGLAEAATERFYRCTYRDFTKACIFVSINKAFHTKVAYGYILV